MKKYCIQLWLFLFLLIQEGRAQNAYYDALKLKSIFSQELSPGLFQQASAVLANYMPDSLKNDPNLNLEKIQAYYFTNAFIPAQYRDFELANAPVSPGRAIAGLFTKAGGIDVTNIADGLAKFLVERTKQELSIAFFQDFQEALESPKYKHLVFLFSNTASLLKTIDRDIYQFAAYIQALREAFLQDLDNLFDTFPEVIRDPDLDQFFRDKMPLRELLLYGLYITKQLKNNVHPGQIIEDLQLEPGNDAKLADLNGVLHTIQFISSSFRSLSPEAQHYWVPGDSILRFVKDEKAFSIYLGLIFAKAPDIHFKDGKTLRGFIGGPAEFIIDAKFLVTTISGRITDLQIAIDDLKNKADKKEITYNEYYHFFESVIKLLKLNDPLGSAFRGIPVNEYYNTFTLVANNINNLYLDINKKNYTSGIMRLVSVYDTVLAPAYQLSTLAAYKDLRKNIVRYGTFMAQVAQAENSDDVQAAIEAVALPAGSASIKKHSTFNIAINAYVGPFYGQQKLASDKNAESAAGIFSPVGVAFSWGIGSGKKPASFSLFASVIDIGAITSFRFTNETDTLASDVQVKLSQIVAPGLHAVVGLPKWPVSFGIGYEWMPLLSDVEQDAATLYDSKGTRWQVFLAVDIPMLNLFTKSK